MLQDLGMGKLFDVPAQRAWKKCFTENGGREPRPAAR